MGNKIFFAATFFIIASIFMVSIDIYAFEPDNPGDDDNTQELEFDDLDLFPAVPDADPDATAEIIISDPPFAESPLSLEPAMPFLFPGEESCPDTSPGDGRLNSELLADIDYSLKVISALMILASAVIAIRELVIRPLRYFADF